MRAALLAHDRFGPLTSKTAVGVLRYRGAYQPVAIIDRAKAGEDAAKFVGPIGRGIPVVADMQAALAFEPEVLIVGIAPQGGALPPAWRKDILHALGAGVHVVSGLHSFLCDDPHLVHVAQGAGAKIWDVRKPQKPPSVATGASRETRALTVLTAGTDCNSGKMTTTLELFQGAIRRGWKAGWVATGQTGLLLGPSAGLPADRIISDFAAGATEQAVLEADAQDHDVIFIEGQGALQHPAYSPVALALLHGSWPDLVVLCHDPTRSHYAGFPGFPLNSLTATRDIITALTVPYAATRCVGASLMTQTLDAEQAQAALASATQEVGLPSVDPVRWGVEPLLDAIAQAARGSPKEGASRLTPSIGASSR